LALFQHAGNQFTPRLSGQLATRIGGVATNSVLPTFARGIARVSFAGSINSAVSCNNGIRRHVARSAELKTRFLIYQVAGKFGLPMRLSSHTGYGQRGRIKKEYQRRE